MNKKYEDIDGISIIGFRFNADNAEPEVYTLMTYGANEIALNENANLIFYTNLENTEKVFSLFDDVVKNKFSYPTDVDAVCDLANALYLLENENEDNSATILNCLNTIFDLFASININFPEDRRAMLFSLADFLTFEKDFSNYLKESSVNREKIIDSIIWCCGKLITRSKIIRI